MPLYFIAGEIDADDPMSLVVAGVTGGPPSEGLHHELDDVVAAQVDENQPQLGEVSIKLIPQKKFYL